MSDAIDPSSARALSEHDLVAAIDRVREETIDTRRTLHRHPELGFGEFATAELIAARCEQLGFAVRTEVGRTGVIADLDSGRPGPMLMLRADMDALPITERSGHAWRSEKVGVMHACGHDGHVAMQLGAAAVLASNRVWNGRLRLCFQPAEETAGGARPMIEDGALKGVDRVLGIHLWSQLPAGQVGVKAGAIFGSADMFRVTFTGRGGHGGMPHLSVDPIMAVAAFITTLQTLISRETSPFSPAVVTVGHVQAGTAFNVIAEEAIVIGTVRAFSQNERDRLLRRIDEIATSTSAALRATTSFSVDFSTPPVVSDGGSAQIVRDAAVVAVGADNLVDPEAITVGDDVAYFLNEVPGCYFLVGAGYPGRENAPHHHPEFDIDEKCLHVGVATMARAAFGVLQ